MISTPWKQKSKTMRRTHRSTATTVSMAKMTKAGLASDWCDLVDEIQIQSYISAKQRRDSIPLPRRERHVVFMIGIIGCCSYRYGVLISGDDGSIADGEAEEEVLNSSSTLNIRSQLFHFGLLFFTCIVKIKIRLGINFVNEVVWSILISAFPL